MVPRSTRQREQALQKWEPPPRSWVKLNTDAAFCHDSGAASAGCIVRDEGGKVLLE
jgi:hypothetical protein